MSIQNSHQIGNVKVMLVKGENGSSIVSITKTGTVGDVDTYTVATSDGGQYTFEVTNGSDIQSIEKTSSHGMVDTYTVTLTNGNTTTFEVTNGDNWIDNSEKTATDAFQTITGGLLKECKVALSPVQSGSGDPSPTNVRPIAGHTQVKAEQIGKNYFPLFTAETKNGITLSYKNGKCILNGTASANTFFNLIDLKIPSAEYTVSCNNESMEIGVHLTMRAIGASSDIFDIPLNALNKRLTFTNSVGGIILYVVSGTALTNFEIGLQLEKGSSATSFEPFVKNNYTKDLEQTVYGGTLDLVSGELVIDKAIKTYTGASDEGWTMASDNRFYISLDALEKADDYSNLIVCNKLITTSKHNAMNNLEISGFYDINDAYPAQNWIYICNTSCADVSAFKTWLSNNNITVAYELATPTTVQLTPTQVETLIGDNNLLCPLAGQAMVEDGVKYFYIYTYRDLMQGMQDIADALEDDVTEITNNAVEEVSEMAGVWTASASASEADTSITITNENITTSSIIEVYCQNASGNPVSITNMAVTTGQAVLSFYALAEATSFRLHILNI